jgi:hypothetical protein
MKFKDYRSEGVVGCSEKPLSISGKSRGKLQFSREINFDRNLGSNAQAAIWVAIPQAGMRSKGVPRLLHQSLLYMILCHSFIPATLLSIVLF